MSVLKLLTGFVHIHPIFKFRNESLLPAHIYPCVVTVKKTVALVNVAKNIQKSGESLDQQRNISFSRMTLFHGKKSQAISVKAWRGPIGSRRLKLPDFKTVGS
jgi:hypothetical protein